MTNSKHHQVKCHCLFLQLIVLFVQLMNIIAGFYTRTNTGLLWKGKKTKQNKKSFHQNRSTLLSNKFVSFFLLKTVTIKMKVDSLSCLVPWVRLSETNNKMLSPKQTSQNNVINYLWLFPFWLTINVQTMNEMKMIKKENIFLFDCLYSFSILILIASGKLIQIINNPLPLKQTKDEIMLISKWIYWGKQKALNRVT